MGTRRHFTRAMGARLALAALGLAIVACGAVFDDPAQCKSDGECARFASAVCDVAQGVCVAASSSDGGSRGPPSGGGVVLDGAPSPAEPDAASDAAVASPCNNPSKPLARVGAASDGSASTDITQSLVLTCDKDWILTGSVFVRAGATLTIEKGTTVKGDLATRGALFVMPGASIVAKGTPELPIVFTSTQPPSQRAPADWRGVFILGKAPPSGTLFGDSRLAWGGADANDASGALKYVRIEYAALGLQMAGVGRGTQLDSIEVRKSGDDAFTWLGGTVNGKRLVCQYPGDECFQFTSGYDGRMQFLLGQRTPLLGADHNGMLVDASSLTAYNVTLCGADVTNAGYALLPRNGARLTLVNAILSGYGAGVDLVGAVGTPFDARSSIAFGNYGADVAYVEDPAVLDHGSPLYDDDFGFDELAWWRDPARRNSESDPRIARCFDPSSPAMKPAAAIGGEAPPSDGFFDPTASYVGAIGGGSAGWESASWIVWDSR